MALQPPSTSSALLRSVLAYLRRPRHEWHPVYLGLYARLEEPRPTNCAAAVEMKSPRPIPALKALRRLKVSHGDKLSQDRCAVGPLQSEFLWRCARDQFELSILIRVSRAALAGPPPGVRSCRAASHASRRSSVRGQAMSRMTWREPCGLALKAVRTHHIFDGYLTVRPPRQLSL